MYRTVATILVAALAGYSNIASARYIEADPIGIVPVPGARVVPVLRAPTPPTPRLATPRPITASDVLRHHQLNHSYAYVNGDPLSNVDPTGEIGLVGAGAAAGSIVFPGPGTLVGAGLGLGLATWLICASRVMIAERCSENVSQQSPSTKGTFPASHAFSSAKAKADGRIEFLRGPRSLETTIDLVLTGNNKAP